MYKSNGDMFLLSLAKSPRAIFGQRIIRKIKIQHRKAGKYKLCYKHRINPTEDANYTHGKLKLRVMLTYRKKSEITVLKPGFKSNKKKFGFSYLAWYLDYFKRVYISVFILIKIQVQCQSFYSQGKT